MILLLCLLTLLNFAYSQEVYPLTSSSFYPCACPSGRTSGAEPSGLDLQIQGLSISPVAQTITAEVLFDNFGPYTVSAISKNLFTSICNTPEQCAPLNGTILTISSPIGLTSPDRVISGTFRGTFSASLVGQEYSVYLPILCGVIQPWCYDLYYGPLEATTSTTSQIESSTSSQVTSSSSAASSSTSSVIVTSSNLESTSSSSQSRLPTTLKLDIPHRSKSRPPPLNNLFPQNHA